MKVEVLNFFKYARDGIHIEEYEPGIANVRKEVAEIAIANGWAKKPKTIGRKKAKK
jgi:hypothetical protein